MLQCNEKATGTTVARQLLQRIALLHLKAIGCSLHFMLCLRMPVSRVLLSMVMTQTF